MDATGQPMMGFDRFNPTSDLGTSSIWDGLTESPCKRCPKRDMDKNECLGSEPFCPGGHERPKISAMHSYNNGAGRPKSTRYKCQFEGCEKTDAKMLKYGYALCKGHESTVNHRRNRCVSRKYLLKKKLPKHKCEFPGCTENAQKKYCNRCNAMIRRRKSRGVPKGDLLKPPGHFNGTIRVKNLSPEDIKTIQKSSETNKKLASQYNVSATTICSIKNRRGPYAKRNTNA